MSTITELKQEIADLRAAVQVLSDFVTAIYSEIEIERGLRQLERNPDLIAKWIGRGEA